MIENLLDSLNALLLQHTHLLHLMHVLFWIRYWILMAIMGVFIYLVYTDARQDLAGKRAAAKPAPGGIFIA
jgi:hypothetical protein